MPGGDGGGIGGDTTESVNLAALKKRRSVYQGLLTKCTKFVNKGLQGIALSRLQVELASLERNFEHYEQLQIEIATIDDAGVVEGDDTRMNDIEDTYITLKTAFLEAIEKKKPRGSIHVEGNNTLDFSSLLTHSARSNLPKLTLPEFNGKQPELFLDFMNTFDSMIHHNNSFDEVDKFRYLKNCLKDDAKQIIAQMEITADNYEIAYQMIRDRYENKALIVESHVTKLFNTTPAMID